MNPYQRVISAGVLYDKERLERGMSTENINIAQINLNLEQLERRERELLKQLNEIEVTEKK